MDTQQIARSWEAETAQQRLAFLAEASQVLASSLDYQATLAAIASLATGRIADWCVVDLAESDGTIRRVMVGANDPARQTLAEDLKAYPADPQAARGPGQVLRTGESLLLPHVADDELEQVARDERHLALLRKLGINSTMLTPLTVRGRHIGVLTYTRFDPARPFGRDDLTLAEELARRAAQAIDNAQLYAAAQAEIEQRRTIERALSASEQRFRATFEQAAVGIAHVALGGRWLRVNQRLCDIVGYPCDELLKLTFQDITHPDDLNADLFQLAKLLDGDISTYAMEKRYIRRDGSRVWINLTVSLVRSPDGWPDYFISVVEDISARKAAETERDRLLERERAARAAAETTAEQLRQIQLVTDATLAYLSLDDLLAELLKRICTILEADTAAILLLDSASQSLEVLAAKGLEAEVAQRVRVPVGAGFAGRIAVEQRAIALAEVDPSQIYSPVLRVTRVRSLLGAPLLVEGRVTGVIHVGSLTPRTFSPEDVQLIQLVADRVAPAIEQASFRDALQRSNEELERRVVERTIDLQEAVDDLNTFTYTISHDLRAPLRSLQGFGSAVMEDYSDLLPGEGQLYLRHIVGAAEQLDVLVQDLLAYSRLSRAELQLKPVDLAVVVSTAVQQVAEAIERSDAQITVAAGLPRVCGHQQTLVQVVANLLSNGMKFVASEVRPSIQVWSERRGTRARLYVADNGIGVAPADQERIFQVFERLHGAETYPGTGIGLAIVRKGVERMGGQIGVESQPQHGSRFWIELPLEDV